MAFKRALWRSGLTYQRTCEQCKTLIQYTDDKLDFRPWYADGFVYCPKCNKPLRHNESYAIDRPQSTVEVNEVDNVEETNNESFCAQCGKKFTDVDRFCSNCGKKRK